MNIIAYAVRPDELAAFEKYGKELNLNITKVNESLNINNVALAKDFDGVAILGNCSANREVLAKLHEYEIKYLASRSAGYNNIDLVAAKEYGIKVSNANYSPFSVADFAVMLMLMVNRKVIEVIKRANINDYSLRALIGREMHNQCVGVIGTGKIGASVVQNLLGFGCKIVAYDPYPNPKLEGKVEYVSLDELYAQANIITLHIPLTEQTNHLINAEAISKMQKDTIIINTARGELVNTTDLITALKNNQLGGAGLDVLEDEFGILHHDCRFKTVTNDNFAILKSLTNVVITNHCAFYTDQAVSDMVEVSLRSLTSFIQTNTSPTEIK